MKISVIAISIGLAFAGCSAPAPTSPPPATSLTPANPATAAALDVSPATAPRAQTVTLQEYVVPRGAGPHDVAPAPDGTVWYTAQRSGELGRLDPATGATRQIKLGGGSAPHGVIVGPDGAPWVTDGGLNAIVRVDPQTGRVQVYPCMYIVHRVRQTDNPWVRQGRGRAGVVAPSCPSGARTVAWASRARICKEG
jgi:streptogramin lyase